MSRCRHRCRRRSTGQGGLHAGRQTTTLFAAAALALISAAAQGTSRSSSSSSSSRGFDPYALNGGLVAAVAGPDYCILAADTRLTDGGYQIQSRRYLDGRIWAATTDGDVHHEHHGGHHCNHEDDDDDDGQHARAVLFELDGSLRIPAEESAVPIVAADAMHAPQVPSKCNLDDDDDDDDDNEDNEDDTNKNDMSRPTARRRWIDNLFGITLVGSAGCASDCEQLKRTVRTELAERRSWIRPSISASTTLAATTTAPATTASAVATVLLHTLYSRRPFPYYSFCVLAGLDPDTGTGQVHVYDAIGSHERVAVACAGTPGREMLQPILDRMFTSATSSRSTSPSSSLPPTVRKKQLLDDQEGDVQLAHGTCRATSSPGGGGNRINRLVRDGTALEAKGQRTGTLSLRPPVGTHVNCAVDEAVALLVKAYRSVSEREIGTGDDLVVCVLRRSACKRNAQGDADSSTHDGDDGRGYGYGYAEVMRFPLKKH